MLSVFFVSCLKYDKFFGNYGLLLFTESFQICKDFVKLFWILKGFEGFIGIVLHQKGF